MSRVLISDPIAESAMEEMKEAGIEVVMRERPIEEAIVGFDGAVVRSATKVTKEVLDAADKLKVIVRAGVGLDNIDLDYADECGVKVLNTPEAPSVSVAELVFAHMFALARHIPKADAGMNDEKWLKKQLRGVELWQKKLGIIGFGRIGKEIAKRGSGLEMDVLVVKKDKPGREEECHEVGARQVEFDELLREADYLTVNVPLVPETKGMIGKEELEMMKPSAFLVNTARGGIVDEDALLQALNDDVIAGAALDVYSEEPPESSSLWELVKHPKTVTTPHLASTTYEAQDRVGELTAQKVIRELG
ncbi:MAG: hydroxyacid dehydrogenase [Candidatus Thorarchaeota archaeon]|nr:hydroxyacid dehydrogenase [Candidatus Thorarchaeota archaeon]